VNNMLAWPGHVLTSSVFSSLQAAALASVCRGGGGQLLSCFSRVERVHARHRAWARCCPGPLVLEQWKVFPRSPHGTRARDECAPEGLSPLLPIHGTPLSSPPDTRPGRVRAREPERAAVRRRILPVAAVAAPLLPHPCPGVQQRGSPLGGCMQVGWGVGGKRWRGRGRGLAGGQ